jgi:hypothetical protein
MTRSSVLLAVLLALLPAAASAATFSVDPMFMFTEANHPVNLAEGKAFVWVSDSSPHRNLRVEYRNNFFDYYQHHNWDGDAEWIFYTPPDRGSFDTTYGIGEPPLQPTTRACVLTVSNWLNYRPSGNDTEIAAGMDGIYIFHLGSNISGEYEVVNRAILTVEVRTHTDNPLGHEVTGLFSGYLPSCPPSYSIVAIDTDAGNDPANINAVIQDGSYLAFSLLPGWTAADDSWASFTIRGSNGYGSSEATLKVMFYPYSFRAETQVDGSPDPDLGGWFQLDVTSGSTTKTMDGDGERKTVPGAPGQQIFFEASCDGYVYEFYGWSIMGSEYPALRGITIFNKTWEELLEMGGMPADSREGPDVTALFKVANKSTLTVRVKGEGNATPRRSYLAIGESTDVVVTEWCAPFIGFEVLQGDANWEVTNTESIGLGGLANETHRITHSVTLEENDTIIRAVFQESGGGGEGGDDDDDDDGGGTDWPDDDDDDDDDYEPPPPPPGQVYLVIGTRGDGRATPNQVNVAPNTPVQVTFQELGASFKGPVIQTGEATMEAVSQSGSDYAAQYVYNIAPHTDTAIIAPFLREEYPPTVTAYDVRLSKRGTGSAAPQAFRLQPGQSTIITLGEIDSTLLGVEVVSGRADLALLDTAGTSSNRIHRYGVGGVGMTTEILATFQDADGPPGGTKYKLTVKKAGGGAVTPSSVQVESWQRITVVCQESGGVFRKLELVAGVAQHGSPTTSGTTMGARTYSYPVSSVQRATTLLATFEGGGGDDDDDDGGDDDDDDDGSGGGSGTGDDDDDDEVNPLIPAAGAAGLLLLKQKQNLYRPHWSTERPDTPWDARKRGE